MSAAKLTLKRCGCGGLGKIKVTRVAEDAMETRVECQTCGWSSDEVEDAYSDPDTAAWIWNESVRPGRAALQPEGKGR